MLRGDVEHQPARPRSSARSRPPSRPPHIVLARLALACGLVAVALGGFAAILLAPGSPIGWAVSVGAAAAALGAAVLVREERRAAAQDRAADAGLRRLIQGLGRSTSPDAVTATIVDALRGASAADHVVVARLPAGERDIEAILATASERLPLATTRLPADLLGRPGPVIGLAPPDDSRTGGTPIDTDATPAAGIEPLVAALRTVFGLRNLLARPLGPPDRPIGALILSRRTGEPWSAPETELLETAAGELSAALERAEARQATAVGAHIDALTGLPNRGHFDELAALLARGRRAGDALGVLMIDIDHFKAVNDQYGHPVGDAVLRAVAGSIAGGVRSADTPARYGGEEFAVLLRRATPDQACEVALRIRAAVAGIETRPLGVADGRPISVSVGVAVGSAAGETVAGLLRRADDALYSAKRRGRDRVVVDELAA